MELKQGMIMRALSGFFMGYLASVIRTINYSTSAKNRKPF